MKDTKGLKKIWDNHQVIGEVLKTPSTKLVVSLVARGGTKSVNIKGWYKLKTETDWRPSAGDHVILPVETIIEATRVNPAASLMDLIKAAVTAAPAFEIEDEENAVWSGK